jgi:uncharacterized protein YjdB
MKPLKSPLSAFVLFPLVSGCFAALCTLELGTRLEPRAVTLEVGESVTPTVGLYACGGRKTVPNIFVWTSKNPEIASVERTTGTISALLEGQVDVEVLAQEHDLSQAVEVTVVAAR